MFRNVKQRLKFLKQCLICLDNFQYMAKSFFWALLKSMIWQCFARLIEINLPKGENSQAWLLFCFFASGSTDIFCVPQASKAIKFFISMVHAKFPVLPEGKRTKSNQA